MPEPPIVRNTAFDAAQTAAASERPFALSAFILARNEELNLEAGTRSQTGRWRTVLRKSMASSSAACAAARKSSQLWGSNESSSKDLCYYYIRLVLPVREQAAGPALIPDSLRLGRVESAGLPVPGFARLHRPAG